MSANELTDLEGIIKHGTKDCAWPSIQINVERRVENTTNSAVFFLMNFELLSCRAVDGGKRYFRDFLMA